MNMTNCHSLFNTVLLRIAYYSYLPFKSYLSYKIFYSKNAHLYFHKINIHYNFKCVLKSLGWLRSFKTLKLNSCLIFKITISYRLFSPFIQVSIHASNIIDFILSPNDYQTILHYSRSSFNRENLDTSENEECIRFDFICILMFYSVLKKEKHEPTKKHLLFKCIQSRRNVGFAWLPH